MINAQPATPASPTIGAGAITHPTCAVATGSVILSGLPAGNWTINPGAIAGNTATHTISGLAPATYNYTVTNAAGCTSLPSANVVINAQPATPAAPSIGAITQPTCLLATGSVELNGLPASGTWTITESVGSATRSGSGTTFAFDNLAAGNFTFIVTSEDGCSSETSLNAFIIEAAGCDILAGFTANDTVICSGGSVTFTDASNGVSSTTEYLWLFGEGAVPATLTGKGPHTIAYPTAGSKTVQLILSNGVADTLIRNDYITVNGLPAVSLESNDRCGSGSVEILAITDGNQVEFSFDNGNSVIETDMTSPFSHSTDIDEGTFIQVWARAINTVMGCTGTWDSSILVSAWPDPVIERIIAANPGLYPEGYVDVVCAGKEASHYYVNGEPSATYNWRIPEMGYVATDTNAD